MDRFYHMDVLSVTVGKFQFLTVLKSESANIRKFKLIVIDNNSYSILIKVL